MDKGDNDLPSRYYTVYYSSIPHLPPEIFFLKHACSILRQSSNSVRISRKIQVSSPWFKPHSTMEEPHKGVDDCLRMLQACFRKRKSVYCLTLLMQQNGICGPEFWVSYWTTKQKQNLWKEEGGKETSLSSLTNELPPLTLTLTHITYFFPRVVWTCAYLPSPLLGLLHPRSEPRASTSKRRGREHINTQHTIANISSSFKHHRWRHQTLFK